MNDQENPPVHPAMVLLTGGAISVLAGVAYNIGTTGSEPKPAFIVGVLGLSIAGVVTSIGVIGWAVFIALRLNDWERRH